MRVYKMGKPIPMEDVTWKILCDPYTRVNVEEDVDVNWPDKIRAERAAAKIRILKLLGLEVQNDQSNT